MQLLPESSVWNEALCTETINIDSSKLESRRVALLLLFGVTSRYTQNPWSRAKRRRTVVLSPGFVNYLLCTKL